jgi:dTMP kinase
LVYDVMMAKRSSSQNKKAHRPFIVIEALDAGGSQTQTNMLAARLKKEKYIPHQYHFPQEDFPTGRLIYDKFLLYHNKRPFSRREQALLFIQDFFSRSGEMHRIVEKGKKKDVIVSDRYCTSNMSYQTIGLSGKQRKNMIDWIAWLCWKGQPALPKPDLVILLDTPVDISLQHLASKKKDYHENREKLTAFRRSYVALAREQKWVVITSANEEGRQRSKKDIHEEVWQHVQRLLH